MATPVRPVATQKRAKRSQSRGAASASNDETTTEGNNDPGFATDSFAYGYDFLIVNSPMEESLFFNVVRCVSENKKHKKLLLVLVSWGGLADPAYRTGRYLQSVYDHITAFIPATCKSAGTLLAIAANSIIMSPFGELGPLDVQLRKKDEIFGRRSGLITRAAISDLETHTFQMFENFMLGIIQHSYGGVSFKVAADISARTASEIMGKIYEQINPDSLGQDFRDLSVATKYGERLAKWSKNIKEEGIRRLVHEYPSHDFVIDSEEAKEIFLNVELPSITLLSFMRDNVDCLMEPRDSAGVVIRLTNQGQTDGTAKDSRRDRGNAYGQPKTNGRDTGTTNATP